MGGGHPSQSRDQRKSLNDVGRAMRNAKKLFPPLLSILLIFSLIVPASAAAASASPLGLDRLAVRDLTTSSWKGAPVMVLNTGSGLVRPMVAAGGAHTVGLKCDGTVVAAGYNLYGQCNVGSWTDIVQVAAGYYHTVGLKSDGTVVAVGWNYDGRCNVGSWTDIVQVAAGGSHTVGLKSDGSVVAVGRNDYGQCDVGDWTNMVQVAAGGIHTLGLRCDGSVVAVGRNDYGQCDVGDWTHIVQVATHAYHTVALKSDGTVVSAGPNFYGERNVSTWTDIVRVAAGGSHTVGLKSDGTVVAAGAEAELAKWNLGATAPPPEKVTQAWVARYNSPGNGFDRAVALAVDETGSVYVTGISQGSGTNWDYATVKYDTKGNQLWVARYNGPANGEDQPSALAVDSGGNVYVTGFSAPDCATIKYDSSGNELWIARYDGLANYGAQGHALAVDGLGNVYVAGQSWHGSLKTDYFVVKYDADGNQLWVASYNGPADGEDLALALALDSARNVYVTGYSQGIGTSYDYATVKYDCDGNELWVARYDGPESLFDVAFAVVVDDMSNVYVTGYSRRGGTWPEYADFATVKYDTDGNQLWVALYNGPGVYDDLGRALALDGSGNLYVVGDSAAPGHRALTIVKYSPDGDQLWEARYDGGFVGSTGTSVAIAKPVAVDSDGSVYVTGSILSATAYDYLTIKYDAQGNQVWSIQFSGPGNGQDWAGALALDIYGNVYVTGGSVGEGGESDYATIKYVQRVTHPAPTVFSYPLDIPWTDTLGFGQAWSTYLGHLGEDYGVAEGTPVYAVASGQVILRHDDPYPGQKRGWGNALIIRHAISGDDAVYSQYAHLQTVLVDEGDTVQRGQQVGTVGKTGFATGPHLHFEIKDTPELGPGYAGQSFTGDAWPHAGVTYYRPSTFIEPRRGFRAGDELRVTGTGTVGLRLRESPSLAAPVITVMPEGSQVTVLAGPVVEDGYGWWQVQFGEYEGWAAGRYLTGSPGPHAEFQIVRNESGNVLLDASASYSRHPRGGVASYVWNISDDYGNIEIIQHSPQLSAWWLAAGTYKVSLTIYDLAGGAATTAQVVSVTETWFDKLLWILAKELGYLDSEEHLASLADSSARPTLSFRLKLPDWVKWRLYPSWKQLAVIDEWIRLGTGKRLDWTDARAEDIVQVLRTKVPDETITFGDVIAAKTAQEEFVDAAFRLSIENRLGMGMRWIRRELRELSLEMAQEALKKAAKELAKYLIGYGTGVSLLIDAVLLLSKGNVIKAAMEEVKADRYLRAFAYYIQLGGTAAPVETHLELNTNFDAEARIAIQETTLSVEDVARHFAELYDHYRPYAQEARGLKSEYRAQVRDEVKHLIHCLLRDNRQSLLDTKQFSLKSPGELRVYDSLGNIVGVVNGQVRSEVENGVFIPEENTVLMYGSVSLSHIEVIGTGQGYYGLTGYSRDAGTEVSFGASDIPVTPGAVHRYTFDWQALARGRRGVTVQVDLDGDGTVDYTFKAGSVLTGDKFGPPSSGCFIATAAYGTPMAEEIQILREFRDEYLLTNPLGQAFVDFYYRISPPIADFITEHPSLKPIVRAGLMPAVAVSTVAVNTTPSQSVLILGLLVLVFVAFIVFATRQRGKGPEHI